MSTELPKMLPLLSRNPGMSAPLPTAATALMNKYLLPSSILPVSCQCLPLAELNRKPAGTGADLANVVCRLPGPPTPTVIYRGAQMDRWHETNNDTGFTHWQWCEEVGVHAVGLVRRPGCALSSVYSDWLRKWKNR